MTPTVDLFLKAEKVRQALLERKKQEFEEEKKKAEADLRRKAGRHGERRLTSDSDPIPSPGPVAPEAEAERLRRETEAKNQKNQRIQEMLGARWS